VSQPASQRVSQSVSQSVSQPASQSVSHSVFRKLLAMTYIRPDLFYGLGFLVTPIGPLRRSSTARRRIESFPDYETLNSQAWHASDFVLRISDWCRLLKATWCCLGTRMLSSQEVTLPAVQTYILISMFIG